MSPGIVESLGVARLDVPPPVSAGAKMASELARTLGMAGAALDEQAQLAEQRRLRQAREDAQLADVDRGQSHVHSAQWLPGQVAAIAEGRITPAGDDADIEVQVADLIEEQLQGDFSEVYRNTFRERVAGPLTSALTSRRTEIRRDAAGSLLGTLSASLLPDVSDDELRGIVGRGRSLAPDLSESEYLAKAVLPALERSSAAGDTAMVGRLSALLPAEFATEKQRASMAAERNADLVARRRDEDAEALVRADLARTVTGEGSYQAARDRIDQLEAAGRVGVDAADVLRASVRIHEESASADSVRKRDETAYDSALAGYTRFVESALDAGQGAFLPDTFPVSYPSGKDGRAVKRADVIAAAIDRRFATIEAEGGRERDRLLQAGMPEPEATRQAMRETLSRKVGLLAANGGAAVYEPWARMLNAAAHTQTQDPEVAPALVQAVALYEHLDAMEAYSVLTSHLTDDDSREFLRTVALQRMAHPDAKAPDAVRSIPDAIRAASRIRAGSVFDGKPRASVTPADVESVAGDLPGRLRQAENAADLVPAIAARAEAYTALSGVGKAAALAQAVKDVAADFTSIDGTVAHTRGRTLPTNLDELLGALKAMYVAKHGAEQRLEAKDLRAVLGRGGALLLTGTAQVGDRTVSDRVPVPASPALTMEDLEAFSAWQRGIAAAKQRRESGRRSIDQQSRAASVERVPVPVGGRFRDGSPLAIVPGRRTRITPAEAQALDLAVAAASEVPPTASPDLAEFMRYWLANSEKRSRSPFANLSPETEHLLNRPAPGLSEDLR